MARNKKKRRPGPDASELARRELEKGNAKSAVKQARLAYRVDASEDNRSLLRRSLLGRGKELFQTGMIPQAAAVLTELSRLGELPDELAPEFQRLYALVGGSRGAGPTAHADPVLVRDLADQAVLRGAVPGLPAEMTQQASRIREALEAIEAGDDQRAIDLVQDIGRNSPLIDWKLLVRGLVALAQDDLDRVQLNWDRLRTDSPTRHIALSLLAANHLLPSAEVPPSVQRAVANMRRRLTCSFGLDLRRAATCLVDGDHELAEFRTALREVYNAHCSGPNRELAQRAKEIILDIAAEYLLDDEMQLLLHEFPVSPAKACRLLARAAEFPDCPMDGYLLWLDFLQALPRDSSFSPLDQRLAETAVHYEMARRHAAMISITGQRLKNLERGDDDFEDWDASDSDEPDDEVRLRNLTRMRQELGESALKHIDHACRLSPDYAPASFFRGVVLSLAGNEDEALQSDLQCLRDFPDEQEEGLVVVRRWLESGRGGAMAETARRLMQLAPRNADRRNLYWRVLVAAYCDAVRGRDEARAAPIWSELTSFDGEEEQSLELRSLQIAAALKDGRCTEADRMVKESRPSSRMEFALQIAVAAAQMALSKTTQKGLRQDVAKQVKERKSTKVAVAAVQTLARLAQSNPATLAELMPPVCDYLKRCSRLAWTSDELLEVCRFLFAHSGPVPALVQLAARGRRQFPRHPQFRLYGLLAKPGDLVHTTHATLHSLRELIEQSPEPLNDVEQAFFGLLVIYVEQQDFVHW